MDVMRTKQRKEIAMSPAIIMDKIRFDESFGVLPRKPSFWLDDMFFWTPIILEAAGEEHIPAGIKIKITSRIGDGIEYDKGANVLSLPIGIACSYYNRAVEEMSIKPSAIIASSIEPGGFFTLWNLYSGCGIDPEPWLGNIVFQSLVHFRFKAFLDFLINGLNRDTRAAGQFLDDMLRLAIKGSSLSKQKQSKLLVAITQEPDSNNYTIPANQRTIAG